MKEQNQKANTYYVANTKRKIGFLMVLVTFKSIFTARKYIQVI